jgi:hypothetical protein
MDWNKLQHTLYNLDPTDPREDFAKLRAAAQDSLTPKASETVDYIAESTSVPEGSLKMDRDYSVADFAALAGVRLDEKQKHGDYARGKDPMPKAEPGRTKHPLKDKLVGENEFDEARFDKFKQGWQAVKPGGSLGPDALERGLGNIMQPSGTEPVERPKRDVPKKTVNQDPLRLQPFVKKYQNKLTVISQDPALAKQFDDFMKKIPESTSEAKKPEAPKQRNPIAAHAQRSGAGVHKDQNKKNQLPRKEKHKSKVPMESIKEMLYRKLAEKK